MQGPRGPMLWNESQPNRVPLVLVKMVSDKRLSRYELENFNPEIPHFEDTQDFDPVAPGVR